MNAFEKAIAVASPEWALRRAQYRLALSALEIPRKRSYDGATGGRRGASFRGNDNSANAETAGKAKTLRGRVRDLERNNAWTAKALQVIVSNTIGTGIRCQPQGPNKKTTKKAADLWQEWAETPACDWDGRNDLYGLQALVMRTVARDGEAIVRYRVVYPALIPLQLQVLEPDFLDTIKQTADGTGNQVIQGVEIDGDGRAVAYWLYQVHPGETGWFGKLIGRNKSVRVEADKVARIFRQDRAGQLRGVTWFSPVMLPLRDLDDYEEAQLIRQKIAASFAVFVTDATGGDGLPSDSDEETDEGLIDKIEPGMLEELPPGKDIKFTDPPSVEGFSEFESAVLHKVAAGLGITYESLTGNLSQVNFSSARMGWLEFQRNLESWRWQMLIPQFCVPTWQQFARVAGIAGTDLSGLKAEWTAPRREMINPKEEVAAIRDAIRSGQTSWSEAVRELGWDPEVLLDQIEADAKRFDARGLVLDCDPRKTTQQGQPRDKAPTPGKKPDS